MQRTTNERLTHRVMLGTMAGGENPGINRPEKNWAQCLTDIRVFRATEGSMDRCPLLFGVEMVLWPRATKNCGNWYRGKVFARTALCRDGTGARLRRAAYATQQWTPRAVTGGNRGGGAGGRCSRTDTAVEDCGNEMVVRVARYRFD